MLAKLIHTLHPHQCIKHMKINGSRVANIRKVLVCERCGQEIAFKCGSKVYPHAQFKRWGSVIRDFMCEEFSL